MVKEKITVEPRNITIKELVEGYEDKGIEGIFAWGGKLDVRPPYQREFVYRDKNEHKRDAVIDTILNDYPLGILYWVDRDNTHYEVLDGQQRILSICQFYNKEFSIHFNDRQTPFHGLTKDENEQFLNYPLMIYFCSGEQSEKLKWFRRINVAGEPLNEQELLNASYAKGNWLADAKRIFSKPTNNKPVNIGKKYFKGDAIRQDYLRVSLKWINKGDVEGYMAEHEMDENAEPLLKHFIKVIDWAKATFGEDNTRKEMRAVDWGALYDKHKDSNFSANKLEKEVKKLMADEEVTSKKGIYPYVLSDEDDREKYLNLRKFNDTEKRTAYERQDGICENFESPKCRTKNNKIPFEDAHADHKKPWSKGGKTEISNCQILCPACNLAKGARY